MTAGDVRAVLFDLDGTLIDSERLILASYRHTMREHLGHVPPEETWKATIGQPLVVQMKMFAERADQVESMIQTYVDHNLANHDSYVRPFAGVRSVVEAMRRVRQDAGDRHEQEATGDAHGAGALRPAGGMVCGHRHRGRRGALQARARARV